MMKANGLAWNRYQQRESVAKSESQNAASEQNVPW
jgi:hypothetical protein